MAVYNTEPLSNTKTFPSILELPTHMKYLPALTTLLWLVFLLGFFFLPDVVKQDAVQIPMVLLLSIFLPVSFWQLAKAGKKSVALFFTGIFFFNIGMLLFAAWGNYTAHQSLTEELHQGLQPQLAQYVETAASENKRRVAAQIIYHRHGITLPYKNDSMGYTLFTPTEADQQKYQEHPPAESKSKLRLQQADASTSLQTAVLLLLIHTTLFVLLLVFLILYDNKEKEGTTTQKEETPAGKN